MVALGINWVSKTLAFIRRHMRAFNLAGGSVLILVGVLMVSGIWVRWIYQLQNLSGTYLTPV